jgi:hypothetical protein
MSKSINLAWSGNRFNFDTKEMSKDDPDRIKIVKAIQLLRKAERLGSQANELHAAAVEVISPLELEVNFGQGNFFVESSPMTIELSEDNSSVELSASDGGLSVSYSVSFSMETTDDVTDETYDNWLGEGGWDWVGLTFASDGYVSDSGSQMDYSIDEDE